MVNWHQIIDERNYEMDQVIVSALRRDPAKLDPVLRWNSRAIGGSRVLEQLQKCSEGVARNHPGPRIAGVIEILSDKGSNAARLRQSSPSR